MCTASKNLHIIFFKRVLSFLRAADEVWNPLHLFTTPVLLCYASKSTSVKTIALLIFCFLRTITLPSHFTAPFPSLAFEFAHFQPGFFFFCPPPSLPTSMVTCQTECGDASVKTRLTWFKCSARVSISVHFLNRILKNDLTWMAVLFIGNILENIMNNIVQFFWRVLRKQLHLQ